MQISYCRLDLAFFLFIILSFYFFFLLLLLFHLLPFYQIHKPSLIFDTVFFNLLPNGGYSNLFIVATLSKNLFSSKTTLPVKNSYLSTFPDKKMKC